MSKRKAMIKEQQRREWQEKRKKRKTIRHNTAANQEKHRDDWQPLAPDENGQVADRRIMPRDERDRRQNLAALAQQTLSAEPEEALWEAMAAAACLSLGIVTAVGPGICQVVVEGEKWLCDVRGILTAEDTGLSNLLAAGDRVLVRPLEAQHGLIEDVLPRRSGLSRQNSFHDHLQQIIAANVNQLLIIAAWRQPHIWLTLIDEYLIAAERNRLDAFICINKLDLAQEPATVQQLLQPYRDLGFRVILTSAVTGVGLSELRQILHGQTTVLAGMSGVGKSTLLSAIDPHLDLKTKTVSSWSQEGRHTTTQAVLLPLTGGGYVVDTPGIRELGLIGLHQPDLIDFYPDVAIEAARCRFNNCTHSHEPGCAAKRAVAGNQLVEWRLDNYRKLYQQLPA